MTRPRLITTLTLCLLPLTSCGPEGSQQTSEQTTAPATATPSPTELTPGEGTFPDGVIGGGGRSRGRSGGLLAGLLCSLGPAGGQG